MENPYRASRKANVVCALEWMANEPAMFLMAYPSVNGLGFCIPLSRLPKYFDERDRALPGLAEVARQAALRIGLDTTGPTVNLICDVVTYNVADLRSMPKAPPEPH